VAPHKTLLHSIFSKAVCNVGRVARELAFRLQQLTYCNKFSAANSKLRWRSLNHQQVLKYLNLQHRQWNITLNGV
jgi:hypothetical protein